MGSLRSVVVAAVAVSLAIGGCQPFAKRGLLAVGTCVVVDDHGTTPVACSEAHTHTVIAIAAKPEDCPHETDMFAMPADPHDGTTTECFQKVAPVR